jgi:hypothetical protein
MLREIKNVKQSDPALTRRWFQSEYFELFVWSGPDSRVKTFQLCYDLRRRERALTWKEPFGFFHDGVDDGEGVGPAGHNQSGLLTGASRGPFDAEKVNARFMRESADLPIELRSFVLARLHEYALSGEIKRRGPPRRVVRRDDWQTGEAAAPQRNKGAGESAVPAEDGSGTSPAV